uniref:Uncharacterized protein n=1 Tax=viral metagenome TaxID=1070528 RepID=A0A6C0ESX0_9ZZZZ
MKLRNDMNRTHILWFLFGILLGRFGFIVTVLIFPLGWYTYYWQQNKLTIKFDKK